MVANHFGLFCRGRTAGDEELNYQMNSNPVNRSLCGKNHNMEGFIKYSSVRTIINSINSGT